MISGRVIDTGFGIASGYASKLLYEAGLEVVKLEPPSGDPLRLYTAGDTDLSADESGALFKFLHQGQKSVVTEGWPFFGATDKPLEEMSEEVDLLFQGASILIEGFSASELDTQGLLQKYPKLVILSITPWGKDGPWAERPATEFTIQAESGALDMRARLEDSPVRAGGQIVEWVGGAYLAVAALGTLYGMRHGFNGGESYRHIDLSLMEVAHMVCSNYSDLSHSLMGKPEMKGSSRSVEMPEIHPTSDGYIGFTANSRQQFDDFLVLIEKTEWLGDDDFASYAGRRERRKEFTEAVNAWTKKQTQNEVVEKAAAFRIPVAPILNGKTLPEHLHLAERGTYIQDAEKKFYQPRRPWLVSGRASQREAEPAPKLGSHNGKLPAFNEISRPKPADETSSSAELPLAGLSVLDMTCWWAGPSATQMLANFGADVIHLESVKRPDGVRMIGGLFAGMHSDWWERSMFFLHANINKRGLTLDLSTAEGKSLVEKLIKEADVVMENFTPRVMDSFGLGFEEVRKINPSILYVRMPAFGLSGPWRDYPGFAQTMEQISGMAWVTGHEHDQPHNQRGPSDPNAGMHAVFAALVGLLSQKENGKNNEMADIEVPMVESALNASAELVLEYTAYGNLMERQGNHSPHAAPQNIYQCKPSPDEPADENWLAISVVNNQQWEGLKNALGNPGWADRDELKTHRGRRKMQDFLDEELSRWAREQELDEALEFLLESGVPAGRVRNVRDSPEHPQLKSRKYYEEVNHPAVGTHLMPTLPFRLSGVKSWIKRPAPTLGQHSEEILAELGLTEQEISELVKKDITGTEPLY